MYPFLALEIGSGVRIVAVWGRGREACECIPFLALAVGSERHSLCAGPRVAHGIQGELHVSCNVKLEPHAVPVVCVCAQLPV